MVAHPMPPDRPPQQCWSQQMHNIHSMPTGGPPLVGSGQTSAIRVHNPAHGTTRSIAARVPCFVDIGTTPKFVDDHESQASGATTPFFQSLLRDCLRMRLWWSSDASFCASGAHGPRRPLRSGSRKPCRPAPAAPPTWNEPTHHSAFSNSLLALRKNWRNANDTHRPS